MTAESQNPVIPMLDLKAQFAPMRQEVHAAIERVLDSQQFILGAEVEALESIVASYSGCQFGIGVSSGTDALLVALMALGIGPGDEVITSAYSFIATASVIARLGATPVFVDIDPQTLNLDASQIEARMSARTRAIIPVHLGGLMADIPAIRQVADQYGLRIVEDAAQAIGAEHAGRRAGSFGDLGCFSFFPSKNLGGFGDSGMLVTNDPTLAERATLLRNHGQRPKYNSILLGGNFRMDSLQAAILRVKFKYLDTWIAVRQAHAREYQTRFTEAGLMENAAVPPPISLLAEPGSGRHTYHLFQIRATRRDALRQYLYHSGIASEIYYPVPLHLQPCLAEYGYQPGDFPHSEAAARETLALPIYPELSSQMISRIIDSIQKFYSR